LLATVFVVPRHFISERAKTGQRAGLLFDVIYELQTLRRKLPHATPAHSAASCSPAFSPIRSSILFSLRGTTFARQLEEGVKDAEDAGNSAFIRGSFLPLFRLPDELPLGC